MGFIFHISPQNNLLKRKRKVKKKNANTKFRLASLITSPKSHLEGIWHEQQDSLSRKLEIKIETFLSV